MQTALGCVRKEKRLASLPSGCPHVLCSTVVGTILHLREPSTDCHSVERRPRLLYGKGTFRPKAGAGRDSPRASTVTILAQAAYASIRCGCRPLRKDATFGVRCLPNCEACGVGEQGVPSPDQSTFPKQRRQLRGTPGVVASGGRSLRPTPCSRVSRPEDVAAVCSQSECVHRPPCGGEDKHAPAVRVRVTEM